MKAFLMHRDQDFGLERELPPNTGALIQDLELNTLLRAMAAGDKFVFEVAGRAVLSSLADPEAISYRQQVLADCLAQPAVVREIYQLAVEAIEGEKRNFFSLIRASPDSVLRRSVRVLEFFVALLKRLRSIAGEHAGNFRSGGFTRLFAMLAEELGDDASRRPHGGGIIDGQQLGMTI